MSTNDFLKGENIKMIWDVIYDEQIVNYNSKDILQQINTIFSSNIKPFFESEKDQFTNLMEMNKKYIQFICNFIQQKFPVRQQLQMQKKPVEKELITYEDLQADRVSQFEKDYTQRQQEFTNAMSFPVPPTPKFNDNLDGPYGEIDVAMKRVIEERNYEMQQYNNAIDKNQVNHFLKPQETSVKIEKVNKNKEVERNMESSIKYIKIEKDNIEDNIIQNQAIDLNQGQNMRQSMNPTSILKKQISWEDNSNSNSNIRLNMVTEEKDATEINIFKKLKILQPLKEEEERNIKTQNETYIQLEEKVNKINEKVDSLTSSISLILEILNSNTIDKNII